MTFLASAYSRRSRARSKSASDASRIFALEALAQLPERPAGATSPCRLVVVATSAIPDGDDLDELAVGEVAVVDLPARRQDELVDRGSATAGDLAKLVGIGEERPRMTDLLEQRVVGEQAVLVDPALICRVELSLRRGQVRR